MLITEGVDYYYDKNFFKERNWDKGTPIRIFTYQIGTDSTDARELEWIACSNRGWFLSDLPVYSLWLISYIESIHNKI